MYMTNETFPLLILDIVTFYFFHINQINNLKHYMKKEI